MRRAAFFLEFGTLALKGHSDNRQEGKIIAQRSAKCSAAGFTHRVTEAAIYSLIAFIFPKTKLAFLRLYIPEHFIPLQESPQ